MFHFDDVQPYPLFLMVRAVSLGGGAWRVRRGHCLTQGSEELFLSFLRETPGLRLLHLGL